MVEEIMKKLDEMVGEDMKEYEKMKKVREEVNGGGSREEVVENIFETESERKKMF